MSDELVSPTQLEAVAERALTFQRYVFRRSYGVYYATWALAIAVFQLFPYVAFYFLGFQVASYLAIGVAGISVGIAATFASMRNFGTAARTVALRNTLHPAKLIGTRGRLIALWWVVMVVLVAGGIILSSPTFFSFLNVPLLLLAFFIFAQLRRTFPDGIPIEGKLAVVAFSASAVASLAISLGNVSPEWTELPWSATVVTWIFSSLYALKHAPEELVSATY